MRIRGSIARILGGTESDAALTLTDMDTPPKLPPFLQDALKKSRELAEATERWRQRNRSQLERAVEVMSDYRERFGDWMERHGPQLAAIAEALLEFDQNAQQVEREWHEAGLAYLITPLGMVEKLVISLHADPWERDALLEFLECALADEEFVDRVTKLLNDADTLSSVAREHLKHGLAHLRERQPFEAWPPLIIGLEGAFADVAVERGVAGRDGNDIYLLDAEGNRLGARSPSVEKLARELGVSPEDTEFGEFLIRRVYGGKGNPFRHGTARDGVPERSLCLAVAVIGWLDAFVSPGCRDLLRDALVREAARRQEEDVNKALEPGSPSG
jgi:hypothetical protein